MRRCKLCGKIIWPWQKKHIFEYMGYRLTLHEECYSIYKLGSVYFLEEMISDYPPLHPNYRCTPIMDDRCKGIAINTRDVEESQRCKDRRKAPPVRTKE